jgi:hypothetical protein
MQRSSLDFGFLPITTLISLRTEYCREFYFPGLEMVIIIECSAKVYKVSVKQKQTIFGGTWAKGKREKLVKLHQCACQHTVSCNMEGDPFPCLYCCCNDISSIYDFINRPQKNAINPSRTQPLVPVVPPASERQGSQTGNIRLPNAPQVLHRIREIVL